MLKKCNKIILIVLALLLVIMPSSSVLASSGLDIYYYSTKKNTTYTGQQVKYTLNGTTIKMNTPGIITDGTALGSYYDVFSKSALKVSSKYDKAKGTIILKKNGNTIVLTIGSKVAIVNGKSITMSIAPVKVKYKSANVTRILVPTRFVTESLGYTYAWNSTTSTAAITTPLKLMYNNKTVNYTGTQGQVTIDGKSISLGNMPSIIINGTAMLRAKQVFTNSAIGAKYAYNSKTGEITLTKDDIVVKMTIGSNTAYVNDKARTMDTAPLVVKNLDTNTGYVMVPGSFVSSYLGYDYTWNSSSKTSVISQRAPEDTDNDSSGDGPELGDEAIPDSTEFTWNIGSNYTDEYNKVSSLINTTEIITNETVTGNIYYVNRDQTATNKEVYMISSSSPFNNTTVTLEQDILKLHVTNAFSTDTEYPLNGILASEISTEYNTEDNSSDILFSLKDSNVKYDVTLSDDKLTMYVTFYNNYLTSITGGVKDGNNFVELNAMKPIKVNIVEDEKYIILQMNDMINTVGDNYAQTDILDSIKGVQSISIADNIVYVNIEKQSSSTYSVKEEGNKYTITFVADKTEEVTNLDLSVKLPNDVTYDDIEIDDRYYNKQIVLQIPGDYKSFYENNPVTSNNSVVKSISVSYTGGKTEIIINTSKIQGYKLYDKNTSVGVKLGNPRDMYSKIVVLDAGHGGTDPGATYRLNGTMHYEKTINYQIINRSKKYFNAKDSNIKVYYSRYSDYKVSLYDRAAVASQVGADLFISMHMNANTNTSPNGTEIYYYDKNPAKLASGLDSKKFASLFLDALPGKIGTSKRYIHSKEYVVVKKNTVPSILIELGFMSNPGDLAKITSSSVQEKTAKALYDILESIFEQYPTGR
jgi:N-acetylmuramoyl-L-alanine amidase